MNLQPRIKCSVQKAKNGKRYGNKVPRTKITDVSKNNSKDEKGDLSNYVSRNQQLLFSENEMELLIVKKHPNQEELYR